MSNKVGIIISINVNKILKERLYQGKQGKYLDLTMFLDLDNADQYGNNGFVFQSLSKEEREQKVQTPILGNGKVIYSTIEGAGDSPDNFKDAPKQNEEFDEQIPF